MNHWNVIAWFFPELAKRHLEDAERRQLELDRVKRAQELIKARQEENTARIDSIETELRILSRGQLDDRERER